MDYFVVALVSGAIGYLAGTGNLRKIVEAYFGK